MSGHRIFTMAFSKVYSLYVQKAERRNRSKEEVDQIIRYLDKLVDELAKGKAMEEIMR